MKQVILITGGCQGLGKEVAREMIKDGDVVILSKNKNELENTSKELGCDWIFCDITDVEQIKKTVAEVVKKYGRIDILINNAGAWVGGELDDNDYSDVARITLVNTVGTINMTKAVIPIMKKQKSGKIAFINSVDGLEGKVERGIYGSSKWAITGFTQCMRMELEKYNIAVLGFYPGRIKTNLFKNAGVEVDLSDAMEPKEVAQVVRFSLSFNKIVFEQVVFRNLNPSTYE